MDNGKKVYFSNSDESNISTYGTFNDESALQNPEDALPGFIVDENDRLENRESPTNVSITSPSSEKSLGQANETFEEEKAENEVLFVKRTEAEKNVGARDTETDFAKNSEHFLHENHHSDEATEVASYPPGFTVTGSKNLPIPDVEPEVRERRRRRKRKSRVIASQQGLDDQQEQNQQGSASDIPRNDADLFQAALMRPDYAQPAPRVLPPLQVNTAVTFAGTATLVGPALPHLQKTSRPEPVGEENDEFNDPEKGGANHLFLAESGFSEDDQKKSTVRTDEKSPSYVNRQKHPLRFNDGVRKIDYVMAYVDEDETIVCKNDEKRCLFEENLERAGLELEREPKEKSQDQHTYFVKIHVPWEVCLKYAECMKMKMPLKEDRKEMEETHSEEHIFTCNCDWFSNAKDRMLKPFLLSNPEITKLNEVDYYTAEFSREKMEFFDIKDEETFFSNSERSRIAHRVMSEAQYGTKRIEIGIDKLVLDEVYTAAYPLHEGDFTREEPKMSRDENMRRLLYWEWARWGRWYKLQPLDLVREYVGDKLAIYFVWLGFYTQMLMYPSIVGFICFLYSIISLWTYTPTQELCEETYPSYAGNITMCPLCDVECSYWKLKTSCLAARITYVFDNESTIFFAVFMSLWATLFLEFWKRRQFHLSYDWDLVDYDEERDLIRPEYEAQVMRERLNPVTGRVEPFLHPRDRFSRAAFSLITVIFWVLVIIAAVFAIIVYRVALHAIFAATVDFSSLGTIGDFATPSMLTTLTASMISLLVIVCLNKIYEKVALWLTHEELPRTQIEFDDSFTLKMFCFQFVNYYAYLFYIAFFKTSFAGYPGNYNYLFGQWRWEECDAGGCMYELSLQLIIIMFGKQMWNNIIELLLPWALNKYRQWKSRKATEKTPSNDYTRWEKDYDLTPIHHLGLFYEYLEMVIQFGFVTLFVVAFPLAPVLALLNNIVEIRLDANKFICEHRRPLANKCSDIGVWYYLLEFLSTLAVVTNAFTIAITSEAIPKLVYYYAYSTPIYGAETLVGYTNNSLSTFNVSDFETESIPQNPNPFEGENVTECRYKDYRSPPDANPKYGLTLQYWHVIAARLAFVIVMEHVVFFLQRLLDYLIPDRSRALKDKIKREHFLVQKMLFAAEKEQLKRELSKDAEKNRKPHTEVPAPLKQSSAPAVLKFESEVKTTTF